MSDEIIALTITVPIDNADDTKGQATLSFSYSREGLARLSRAVGAGVAIDPSLLIVEWDALGDDGEPLPIGTSMPLRVYNMLLDAIAKDARRRWP